MRLDRFLKVSRLIRRRSLAAEACRAGRVALNGRPAKPSTPVRAGDRVAIASPHGALEVEVTRLPGPSGQEGSDLYRVLDSSRVE